MCPCPHSQAQGETDGEAEWHNAALDFTHAMSYGDYLKLDKVLDAQFPLSPDHNEMLFIIQHQTSELWMKLMLHELRAAREHVKSGKLGPALKMLARVSRIFDQLVHAWAVLATMTPTEYNTIRPYLGQSSGFQSYQYREIRIHPRQQERHPAQAPCSPCRAAGGLEQALHTPSLYDEAIRLMAAQGLPVSQERLARDAAAGTCYETSVEAAWRQVYQAPERYWDLYQLAEKLIDLEDSFRQWRFRHVTTVERIIGFKPGTGGTEEWGICAACSIPSSSPNCGGSVPTCSTG